MPFAVFRRHRKKMLAVLTLLAMFGFILADSLPRLIQGTTRGPTDPEVAELDGRAVRQSEIARLAAQRARATRLVAAIPPGLPIEFVQQQLFGGTSTRELVDALILEREADALGIPATAAMAKDWLRETFKDRVDGRVLARIYNDQFANEVTDEQLLIDLANQIRIRQVQGLAAAPMVSPLDVFQDFRQQRERVSAVAVPFAVDDYLKDVPEPTEAELAAFYEAAKDRYPDPDRGIPGFKIPDRAKAEFLTIDGKDVRPEIPEAELRALYDARKDRSYKLPPLARLPEDPFEPDVTPGAVHTVAADWETGPDPERYEPFEQVRPLIEEDLVQEKTRALVAAKFDPIKATMDAYADARAEAASPDAASSAKARAAEPPDLKALAASAGITYDSTPALTRDQAAKFGRIGDARLGVARLGRGPTFADWLFDEGEGLYEPAELADDTGRYYLTWKTLKLDPDVPPLKDIRDEVVTAYKREKALPLARKAADDLVAQAKVAGGDLKAIAGDRALTTPPVSRLQPVPPIFAQQGIAMPPRPNELPPLVQPGDALRDAIFGLEPGEVAVAPNGPQSIVYAVGLNSRTPATFEELYSPFSERTRLDNEARNEAAQRQYAEWMNHLRSKARLDPAWTPADEQRARRPAARF